MSKNYTFKEYTERMINSRRHNKIVRKALELKAENARYKEALEKAQSKLRSTQENWREQCLFEADEIMTKALEPK